jgi:hypothetical protein
MAMNIQAPSATLLEFTSLANAVWMGVVVPDHTTFTCRPYHPCSSSYFKNAKNLQFSWTNRPKNLGFLGDSFFGWEWADICHKSEPVLGEYKRQEQTSVGWIYIYLVMHLDSHRIWMNPYLDVIKFQISGSIHHLRMHGMYTSDVQLYLAH